MRNAAVAAMAGRVAAVAAMRNQIPTAKSSTYVDLDFVVFAAVKTREEMWCDGFDLYRDQNRREASN